MGCLRRGSRAALEAGRGAERLLPCGQRLDITALAESHLCQGGLWGLLVNESSSTVLTSPPQAHAARIELLRRRLNQALRGKTAVVEQVLACLLARGHLLLEDLPGLRKTTLAKALAFAVGGRFARVQCTPDLLPGDITGFSVFNQKTREFEFLLGPVFADVLLADEINRTTPRTQSALLEAMAERQVTPDDVQQVAAPVLGVRLGIASNGAANVLQQILESVPVPV